LHEVAGIVVAVCWGAVAVVWAVGGALEKLRAPRIADRKLDYGTLLVIAAAIPIVSIHKSAWAWLSYGPVWVRALGIAIVVAGTAGTLWARLSLGLMWSSRVVVRQEHALRTRGPYAITRHPIYTGMLTMLAGTTLALGLGRWTFLFLVVTVGLSVKARIEERLLSNVFPAQYADYRRRVPALIPRPHRRLRVRDAAAQRLAGAKDAGGRHELQQ
jgi:protein-S-isoprenylcysteine O-methyltransferase Ste14